MMPMNDNFLDSVNFISENQAEYSILSDLYSECENMIFIFELLELSKIKYCYSDVVKFINDHYKSFELNKFSLDSKGKITAETLLNKGGSSLKDEELFNIAIEITNMNNSYVLVRARGALVLINNGKFDHEFKNIFADKQALIELDSKKRNIDQLELVFENFHSERKYSGCDYIDDTKVKNSVTEQQLRNHLINYLRKVTKLHVVTELCTSQKEDEESVDIGVIDSDNEVAIIEVKYFVAKGFFVDPNKYAYAKSRFKDGYNQLDRYCVHLNQDSYKLHSAFLYMFYAHTDSIDKIYKSAESYLKAFCSDKDSKCSDHFKHHYKNTICDNMVDIRQ